MFVVVVQRDWLEFVQFWLPDSPNLHQKDLHPETGNELVHHDEAHNLELVELRLHLLVEVDLELSLGVRK